MKINSTDKALIPYQSEINDLIFKNTNGNIDTVRLFKKYNKTHNLDFFIDKNLSDRKSERKKPYYESYSTNNEVELNRTIKNKNQPRLKYSPFIFSFNKYQSDSLLSLYYFIDGRWSGTIEFNKSVYETINVDGKIYSDIIIIKNDSLKLFEIDKMYWSVKSGLIQIDEKNGEKWVIVIDEI
ncbi:MAG: hypothetical protein KDD29_04975 [Flavobacteriales bacterium]|nr:hypothetical protein [Flavobacteriales bacterium]